MSVADDRADAEKVMAGNTAAFEGIVKRWQSPLINLAYRFCRDRSRAEEMAQEAFLRAYRSLGQWRKEAVFSTWLFALATNVYRSELRRIPAKILPLHEIGEPVDLRTFGDAFENDDWDRAIHQAVLALPPKYRDALILFYFQDMNVCAAANSLGLPDGTVKARLFRGRELLRAKLQHVVTVSRLKGAK